MCRCEAFQLEITKHPFRCCEKKNNCALNSAAVYNLLKLTHAEGLPSRAFRNPTSHSRTVFAWRILFAPAVTAQFFFCWNDTPSSTFWLRNRVHWQNLKTDLRFRLLSLSEVSQPKLITGRVTKLSSYSKRVFDFNWIQHIQTKFYFK